jgi:hypothetical protein
MAIPDGFNWDLWLGPVPEMPYHKNYTHNVFRGWYEFGGGSVAVEVSYDDGVTFVPIERTEGALVPMAITVPLVANAIVFGKPLIRFTLTGATAPDLNLGFHS